MRKPSVGDSGVIRRIVGGNLNGKVSGNRKIRQSLGKETRIQYKNSKAVLVSGESRTTENKAKINKDKCVIQTGE